jgi:hypothetical protein
VTSDLCGSGKDIFWLAISEMPLRTNPIGMCVLLALLVCCNPRTPFLRQNRYFVSFFRKNHASFCVVPTDPHFEPIIASLFDWPHKSKRAVPITVSYYPLIRVLNLHTSMNPFLGVIPIYMPP